MSLPNLELLKVVNQGYTISFLLIGDTKIYGNLIPGKEGYSHFNSFDGTGTYFPREKTTFEFTSQTLSTRTYQDFRLMNSIPREALLKVGESEYRVDCKLLKCSATSPYSGYLSVGGVFTLDNIMNTSEPVCKRASDYLVEYTKVVEKFHPVHLRDIGSPVEPWTDYIKTEEREHFTDLNKAIAFARDNKSNVWKVDYSLMFDYSQEQKEQTERREREEYERLKKKFGDN